MVHPKRGERANAGLKRQPKAEERAWGKQGQ